MNIQEKTIKTSSRYWWQEIGAIVLFLIILPIVMILYYGESMYILGGLGLLVGILYLISELRAARRQKITFSNLEFIVKTSKGNFKESRETIRAVKFTGRGQSRSLVLYCDEYNLHIPCKFFDETELMERLKEYFSPGVLHPEAYQKLPQFLEWQESITKKVSNLNRPLKVSLGRSERWLGFFGVGLGVFFAVLSLFSAIEDAVAIIFLSILFGGLGSLVLLSCIGWVEGNNTSISVYNLLRKVDFSWNELREIYVNSHRGVWALVGENSRLIIPNPSSWSGKDKDLLLQLINLKIETSKLEPIESGKPLYWRSKNA